MSFCFCSCLLDLYHGVFQCFFFSKMNLRNKYICNTHKYIIKQLSVSYLLQSVQVSRQKDVSAPSSPEVPSPSVRLLVPVSDELTWQTICLPFTAQRFSQTVVLSSQLDQEYEHTTRQDDENRTNITGSDHITRLSTTQSLQHRRV